MDGDKHETYGVLSVSAPMFALLKDTDRWSGYSDAFHHSLARRALPNAVFPFPLNFSHSVRPYLA